MTPPSAAPRSQTKKTGLPDGQAEQPRDEPNTKPESLMSQSAANQNGTDRPTRAQLLAQAANVPAERRTFAMVAAGAGAKLLRTIYSALWAYSNKERARMLRLVAEAFDDTKDARRRACLIPTDPDALDLLLVVVNGSERLRQQREADTEDLAQVAAEVAAFDHDHVDASATADVEDLARGLGYPLDDPTQDTSTAADRS
ncbi:hypothetical protein [Saccharothrix deserti]|uniref:hypothetical protein n=1 Tax=Saccharothrix deserti TaxID=2593674 RepID=UPI00131E9635|nr:hypothetical protein [Saccharothrix deserti]